MHVQRVWGKEGFVSRTYTTQLASLPSPPGGGDGGGGKNGESEGIGGGEGGGGSGDGAYPG